MAQRKVLLVDDEQLARERLRELLQDAREELATTIVAEAASGPQALALLPECAVDVALCLRGFRFALAVDAGQQSAVVSDLGAALSTGADVAALGQQCDDPIERAGQRVGGGAEAAKAVAMIEVRSPFDFATLRSGRTKFSNRSCRACRNTNTR